MRSVFSMGAKMIKIIKAYDECSDFVSDFPQESMQKDEITERLTRHIENSDKNRVIGVFAEGGMTGLFSFFVLPDEKYIEMLECFSREKESYAEAFRYLADSFPGYDADFVFDPQNSVLKELLEEYGAEFDTEQQKMVLEDYRRMGYGRKLLAKAVEENKPNGMVLHVDVDNAPATCTSRWDLRGQSAGTH